MFSSSSLVERVLSVRRQTDKLTESLTAEDQQVQSMPDASPTKWHLAHTTWFFEELVLGARVRGYAPVDPSYRYLFNSYYEAIGPRHARPHRGLLTRPSLAEIRSYRRTIDSRLIEHAAELDPFALELGLHHEQQHQELILTDIKHLFFQNPLAPVLADAPTLPARGTKAKPDGVPSRPEFVAFGGGVRSIGASRGGFTFDNEGPRHEVVIPAFEIGARLITCGEYVDFIRDGGYTRPELWLSDGLAFVQAHKLARPLYWFEEDGTPFVFTLHGKRPLDRDEPVCHVTFYEADAFARWRGARLPTEAEWEWAATACRASVGDGTFVEDGTFHPRASRSRPHTEETSIEQMFGDVWEWTASPYVPYPGYRPFPGAFAEYNGKFMCNQLVLRGGSALSPRDHLRATYRNFFLPNAAWQMSGIRLARWLA